ncbi:MAG: hypothetical protein H8D71_01220 [Deltaproteobacteria bacterium]|nr:hypothetical protein [Deltaproteobacteria bacterium]
MSKFFAIFAFAVALPMSNSAHAFIKCDTMEDAKKQKKCNKEMTKSVAKARKGSTAMMPSAIGEQFSYLDAANPLDTDDWFLGVKSIGVKKIDNINKDIAKIAGTIRLAKYAAHLNATDKDAAAELGGKLLPELIKLKDSAPKVVDDITKLNASKLGKDPMEIAKIGKALVTAGFNAGKAVKDLPGAIGAIEPIAKGAAGAAVEGAMDKAAGAVEGATDAVKDAAEAVK